MIDGQRVMGAFERLQPEEQQFVRDEAARRGVSLLDAMLEQCLGCASDVQRQLYSLRTPARKGLRLVK